MGAALNWILPILLLLLATAATLASIYHLRLDDIQVNQIPCNETGFFPNPHNQQKYYECVQNPVIPNNYISYVRTCKTTECYDPTHQTKCSQEACPEFNSVAHSAANPPASSSNSTESTCFKDHLQQDAREKCFDETLHELEKYMPDMLKFTASRGNPMENLIRTLRDANRFTRQNYKKMIEDTGKNVFPLMVATDSDPGFAGTGGAWKIYFKDGSMKRVVPVGYRYEMFKSLSHLVLGLFSIVSPYFLNPKSINYQPQLRTFRQNCVNIEHLLNLGEGGISEEEKKLALTILKKAITYINQTLTNQNADMHLYHKYANDVAFDIERAMKFAAVAHSQDTIPALRKIRKEMGEEEWRKMYVVIPTIWPLSSYNTRLQVLEKMMSFEQIKNQVIMVEGASSEDEAKTTLGRVVSDRAAAQLVWGGLEEQHMKDHLFSLSTRRDLLSSTVGKELDKFFENEKEPKKPCPFSGKAAKKEAKVNNNVQRYATMLRS